jgi:hypothetical protein
MYLRVNILSKQFKRGDKAGLFYHRQGSDDNALTSTSNSGQRALKA